jgi:hypothetical protein
MLMFPTGTQEPSASAPFAETALWQREAERETRSAESE